MTFRIDSQIPEHNGTVRAEITVSSNFMTTVYINYSKVQKKMYFVENNHHIDII